MAAYPLTPIAFVADNWRALAAGVIVTFVAIQSYAWMTEA